ncbi:MAG: phosphoglycerate mutase family protein [Clostridia bacterium]|nr:phosphoglycerate mutase family protein [Clostridia bacterium]MDD4376191.1 phosphoglycerate mutase family protein [Clostridia bacterium]
MDKNIYIMRHGISEGNLRKVDSNKYTIDSSIKLAEQGISDVKKAGQFLSKEVSDETVMWVSPFLRTRQTAEVILNKLECEGIKGIQYKEEPNLIEEDFGNFDFHFYDKWKYISPHSWMVNQAKYEDPVGRFYARMEGGEAPIDAYNRMAMFVMTRLERSNYKNNIIVTHGLASMLLITFLLEKPVEFLFTESLPQNASIRKVSCKNGIYLDGGYVFIP